MTLSTLRVDPARLVDGVTRAQMENNPVIEEYIRANFPDAFGDLETPLSLENSDEAADLSTTQPLPATEAASPLNIRRLHTFLRDPLREEGSRGSRRIRDTEGMIPGILYGGDPGLKIYSHQPESQILVKTPYRVLQQEMDRFHHHFESRVYDLTLYESSDDTEGTLHRVLPRDLQRHPVNSTVLYCVNFCRYHAGRPIKIPIVYMNVEESPALKRDGFIVPLQRYIECFVEDGVPIPEGLDLECTGLGFKQVIRTDRVILPEGVRYSDRVIKQGRDFVIGVVFGKGREEEEVAEVAE